MTSVEAFVEIIEGASHKFKPFGQFVPLTNICFFLGAGFSKSWDKNFPTGAELFSFNQYDITDELFEFIDNIGYTGVRKFDISIFKDIAYQLSMQRKYPSIRSRYIDLYNIKVVENEINAIIVKRFKELATINYIKNFNEKLTLSTTQSPEQQNIIKFFRWINDQVTGDSTGIPEGLRPHYITTNYDFLIESIHDEMLGPQDTQTWVLLQGAA